MRFDVFRGALIAVFFVLFLEIGSLVTADSDVFRIGYFVKGGLLWLLLAAVSTLYFAGATISKNWTQIFLSILMFVCAFLSMTFSYKFIMLGFLFSVVASVLCYRWNRDSFSIGCVAFSLVIIAYVYYIEYIDVVAKVQFL